MLYVGVTYTGNSNHRSELPAVTSRSLEPENLLEVANVSIVSGTQMFIDPFGSRKIREGYRVNYVYGFSSGGFSYFLTTQKRNTRSSSFHSREGHPSTVVRVCQNDPNYYSYTEVPIECSSQAFNYSLAKAAYLGKPGLDLANDLGVNFTDDVLFVVMDGQLGDLNAYSALCIYSLKSIEKMFTRNIKRCFNGEGTTGLNFIWPPPTVHQDRA